MMLFIEEINVKPKSGVIYEVKTSCYKGLPDHSDMLKHINLHGNRFKYRTVSGSYTNMECVECGWRFLTMTDTFGERYNRVESALKARNPNVLFNRYKRDKKCCHLSYMKYTD
jgi:hypothetical protein